MSERISPETEMLWSAYDKGECGTAYLKNKMADMEIERDEMVKLARELWDALNRLSNEWEYQEKIGNVPVGRVEATFAQDALDKAKEVLL